MAESTGKKGKKTLDSFADDLDSMLNVDDTGEQQVGLIDDDDAIDRLLVGDVFSEDGEDLPSAMMEDNDQLSTDHQLKDTQPIMEIDEFGDDIDDIIAGLDINPKHQDITDETEMVDIPDLATVAEDVDLSALETVGEIDEFANESPLVPDMAVENIESLAPKADGLESMSEIDEFSDESAAPANENADFLLADFNISASDESALTVDEPTKVENAFELEAEAAESVIDRSEPETADIDESAEDEFIAFSVTPEVEFTADAADQNETIVEPQPASTPPEPVAPPVDYSAEIAGLAAQIAELKRLQKSVKHDIQQKADNEEFSACLENVDSLQTEQKKTRRNLDALVNKKPIGVYIANGVAGVAMLVAAGLGIEAFITKSQVEQLVEIVGQLKLQVESSPTADAADKEMLRKQLDELTVAQSVSSNQLAELTKTMQGDSGAATGKPVGDAGKQFGELSNQDMQMGAAIEALQNKVAALEKGRVAAAAPIAKPVPKKPAVVEENWAVNLVAFKQDWYAKRKAEEFAGKGVAAKVSRTDNKGESWYRLSVDGFKSQYEAAAYAARVKKTLNLDSVWVAKNKD